jgi:hypothetical protein
MLMTVTLAAPVLSAPEDGQRPARPSGAAAGKYPGNKMAGSNNRGNGPGYAAQRPQTRPARPPGNGSYNRPPGNGGYNRPPGGNYNRPPGGNYNRPPGNGGYNRPNTKPAPGYNGNYRPNRPGGNNNVNIGNTVIIPGGGRYPVYRPPGGGYYRPPGGGYYRPPRPPGGWGGGFYPPPGYYYNDGPSVGDVIAGVAVTGSLLYLLSQATKPDQPPVIVQGGPPPMPAQPYRPPAGSSGAPARINVDLGGLTPAARPTASVCITEAARQIGATGGTEIRLDRVVDVEPGNGGYRFRVDLLGIYPDETRRIPMYCRATPEKIVELTFG